MSSETKTERNAEVYRLFAAGESLRDIGKQCGISYEAVRLILKRAGMVKANPRKSATERDEFLGVNVSEIVKVSLQLEAIKKGVSMSVLTSEAVSKMLADRGYPVERVA